MPDESGQTSFGTHITGAPVVSRDEVRFGQPSAASRFLGPPELGIAQKFHSDKVMR